MKFTRQEKSWMLYDWANSVYATVMIAAIFPIYFNEIVGKESGDSWWGIGTAIATVLMAVIAPVIGAAADFKGNKKRVFSVFLIIGLAATLVSALTDIWQIMLIGYVISHIGFSGSCLVYDSFLTDVTTRDRMDKVSSYGFAMGYIGGSTIPFVAGIVLIQFGGNIGIDSVLAVKLSVIIAVLWWGGFSIPMLKDVKQQHGIDSKGGSLIKESFSSIFSTMKRIVQTKAILVFMIAYFFYIDGVNTVINMATSYGATLGLSQTGMILALLVTQIVAIPCAIIFGRLSKKFGSIKMIKLAVAVYIVICITGFSMGLGLEEGYLTNRQAIIVFWAVAILVGTVQGGIQAISRSYFGKLVPPELSGEYFGFFDISGKFAAALGPALYSITKITTGRSSFSILSIIVLFIAGFAVLQINRKHLKE